MPSPTTDEPRMPGGRRVATVVLAAAALLALSLSPTAVAADLGTAALDGTTVAQQTNEPPTASFTHSPSNPEPGQPVRLNATTSSDPDGEIVAYRWDIDGDGQPDIDGGANQRLSFPRAGTYTVGLTVEDDAGATDTTTQEIVVSGDQPPVANLEISKTEVVVGETTTLSGTGSSDPDGQIVSMAFDTDGDGTFDRSFDAPTDLRFEYAEPGTYQVTLRVTDNDGFTDTATGEVVVESASPTATDGPTTPATQSPTVGANPPPGAGGDGLGTRLSRLATSGVGIAIGGLVALILIAGVVQYARRDPQQAYYGPQEGSSAGSILAALVVLLLVGAPLAVIGAVFEPTGVDVGVALGLLQLGAFALPAVMLGLFVLFQLSDALGAPGPGGVSAEGFQAVTLLLGFVSMNLLLFGVAALLRTVPLPSQVAVAGWLVVGAVAVVPLALGLGAVMLLRG